HLDDELGVEAEPAAALRVDGGERGHVEAVLALVVGGTAPVEPIAIARRDPRPCALGPQVFKPQDDVAVTIAQHRRQVWILVAAREPDGALTWERIGEDLGVKAETGEGRHHLPLEIGVKLGQTVGQLLALGLHGHAPGKISFERAIVDIGAGARDGTGAACCSRVIWHANFSSLTPTVWPGTAAMPTLQLR